MDIQDIIKRIFGEDFLYEVASDVQENSPEKTIGEEWNYTLENVKFTLNKVLNRINPNVPDQKGRIGPNETVLNNSNKSRLITLSPDKLTAICSKMRGSGTIQANTALYKGKWQYEVQLNTCGVMQIGWGTIHCKFMRDTGVGDTLHSYAFDGQRKKKWNKAAQNYGESWLTGDIIGSTIDLDEGTIEFHRNGFPMGIAFDEVQMGPGMAYFPAISLSSGEVIVANFGGSPFKYPVSEYEPIQKPPIKYTTMANMLLDWITNLLKLHQEMNQELHLSNNNKVSNKALMYLFATLLFRNLSPLLNKMYVIEECLLPFIKCLIRTNGVSINVRTGEYQHVSAFLDYAWMLLEAEEISYILDVITESLDSTNRRVAYNIEFLNQKESLSVLNALIRHQTTRRHLISKVFFHKVKIHNFLHIKPIDDKNLSNFVSTVCWEHEKNYEENQDAREKYLSSIQTMYDSISEVEQLHLSILRVLFTNTDGTALQCSSRKLFLGKFREFLNEHNSMITRHKPLKISGSTLCSNFFELVSLLQVLWEEEIEQDTPVLVSVQKLSDDAWRIMNQIQLGGSFSSYLRSDWYSDSNITLDDTSEIRYSVANSNDNVNDYVSTSRRGSSTIFSSNLPQTPAETNLIIPANQQQQQQTPLQDQETQTEGEENPYLDNNENERAHSLDQILQQETESASEEQQSSNSANQELLRLQHVINNENRSQPRELIHSGVLHRSNFSREPPRLQLGQQQQNLHPVGQLDVLSTPGNADSKQSLEELLNSIIILFKCGVNQQLINVASIKTKMGDHIKSYNHYKKLQNSVALVENLNKYYDICRENIDMDSRHVAWILSAIYSSKKQQQLAWVLSVILRTLDEASGKGSRFKLIPCFYVESMLMITSVLRTHCEPLRSVSELPDSLDLLNKVAEFLASHVPDDRITDKNVKDLLQESAAQFFSSPLTMKCMESVSDSSKTSFIRNLLKAYQGTNWAQSNWILVRIWHGSGFAFRYTRSPHLNKFGSDLVEADLNSHLVCVNNTPCPSSVYQEGIKNLLLDESNVDLASLFMNSLLNQLNWAFSEFIGMLQIMQNQTSDRVTIQIRHILVAATCFEILVCLLRVLEMVVVLARPLFTDQSRQNAANMLERLVQFLSQLLVRTTSSGGCFNFILNLDIRAPEFLVLDQFPILSAVAGILVALLDKEVMIDTEAEEVAPIPPVTRVLLTENFPLWSIQYILNEGSDKSGENDRKIPFSFEAYNEDVLEEEIAAIRRVLICLQFYQRQLSTTSELNDDDNKCSICYNYNNSAKFEPCGHESCTSCINHHLLNNRLCFFCKTQIMRVLEQETGTILHDFTQAQTQRQSA